MENVEIKWESILFSRYVIPEKYVFDNAQLNELCSGGFLSSEVEIVEVFNRAVRFSVSRGTNDQLFFSVLFTEKSSVETFFSDVRLRQIEVMTRFTIQIDEKGRLCRYEYF